MPQLPRGRRTTTQDHLTYSKLRNRLRANTLSSISQPHCVHEFLAPTLIFEEHTVQGNCIDVPQHPTVRIVTESPPGWVESRELSSELPWFWETQRPAAEFSGCFCYTAHLYYLFTVFVVRVLQTWWKLNEQSQMTIVLRGFSWLAHWRRANGSSMSFRKHSLVSKATFISKIFIQNRFYFLHTPIAGATSPNSVFMMSDPKTFLVSDLLTSTLTRGFSQDKKL